MIPNDYKQLIIGSGLIHRPFSAEVSKQCDMVALYRLQSELRGSRFFQPAIAVAADC
jgi:hypothetical protein